MPRLGNVLIVGGISGMALGVALKRAGILAEIIELSPQRSALGTGISLQGPALCALRAIGMLDQCQDAVAIVLASDPEAEMRTTAGRWREQFGFTPAEANFALEIAKGDGRQAAADRLGITVGTARSHLSAIFDKAGVRHQAELVRLLLQK